MCKNSHVLVQERLHSLLIYLSKHSVLTNLDSRETVESGTIPNVIAATNNNSN